MGFLYTLEGLRSPFLDRVMSLITELGGETVYMALAIVIFWCVSKSLGYYILSAGFFGTIANQFMKLCFRIPRPWVLDPSFSIVESARGAATGYSFPSGHTQNIFSSFGCMARWTRSRALRVVCCLAVVLVAFSRMYLGVHTPLDVGVAFLMGLALVLVLYPLFRDIERRPRRMYALLGVMIGLTVAYLAYTELWPFPADMDAANLASGRKNAYNLLGASSAMLLAFWFDTRYLHFPVRAGLPAQLVKVAGGLLIVLGIKAGLKAPLLALFGGKDLAHAVRYFLVVLFAAGIWPMSFRWFAAWGKPADGEKK